MREVNTLLAPAAGGPPPGHADALAKLLDLVQAGKEKAALAHLDRFLSNVDKLLTSRLLTPLANRQLKPKTKV